MSLVAGTMTWETLAEAIAAAGTYSSIAEAIEAGVIIINGEATTALTAVTGGSAVAYYSATQTALEAAKAAEMAATASKLETAGATLLSNGASGFKLGGLATVDLATAAAIIAPIAGVNLGIDLYEKNPSLWGKISAAMMPYCYAENKIRAYIDYLVDPETGVKNPVMLLSKGIYDALKSLFNDPDTGVHLYPTVEVTDSLGRTLHGSSPAAIEEVINSYVSYYIRYAGGSGMLYPSRRPTEALVWGGDVIWEYSSYKGGPVTYVETWGPGIWHNYDKDLGLGTNDYSDNEILEILREPEISPQYFPPTAGVSAPTAPVIEPETWPFPPLVIPDPLGPDYQPLPTIPVPPPALPEPAPIPALPEHVPDPTPEKPEEWPEEEPWPSIVPFPFPDPDPSTEPGPDPDWPEIIPWPLPSEPPEEWPDDPPENWPKYPPSWPEEFPEELPWPSSPEDWPTEVPWPENPPEWWPDGTPWPTQPEEWPETVPWPMPPSWPVPWPPYYPYPWPYPYPKPSPDPYPDPEKLDDPETQIDPYIDPWPRPWPYPWPDPKSKPDTDIDPTRDPTQPEPKPEPRPDPDPRPDPINPTPTPPEGDIDPPVPPIVPLPFSSTTGLISVYHPSQSQLLAFANWLWVTWQDATIDKIWNNPFDGVITLFELYCTPTDVGTKNIRSGFLDSGINSPIISRYTEIDCGSIGVPEYFGNYLDYAPYSKCHMYLPFIGIVELNVDDIVGHGVNVTYKIDEYNGSCIAMITVAKSTDVNGVSVDYSNIMYQFSGNCAVELPLSGGSQAAIRSGMIEAAAWGIGSVIGGVMSGNSLGDIGANLAYGVASAVHSVVSAKSSVQHSGSFGSSYGAMGCKKPFIIVTRPKQIQVPNYNEHYGYQAHKMVRVGDCTGYLRCREVHVISPTASDEEKAQIEQLMKTGVYVTE